MANIAHSFSKISGNAARDAAKEHTFNAMPQTVSDYYGA
jgi:hypothetical protein